MFEKKNNKKNKKEKRLFLINFNKNDNF